MAANMKDPRTFFSTATPAQFEYVYNLYEDAVKLKAELKNKKVADYLKLDKWFQTELPKRIKSRGKDTHLVHEELVQCMKWKLSRGKFSPKIKDLVQMNTPRLCITETKKAFRALLKKDDLGSAIQALCNLKGVGPAMASVILTAADPTSCGFMADECLLAIPAIESIDYTTKELLNFVEQIKLAANRLNSSGGSGWHAHRVEQTLWALFILNDNKKELLEGMPSADAPVAATAVPSENGTSPTETSQKNGDGESSSDSADSVANKENVTSNSNGTTATAAPRPADEEDSNTNDSNTNDSLPASCTQSVVAPPPAEEDTNDSIAMSGCTVSPVPAHGEDSVNTASPPQQVSEDTNDSLPQQSSSQQPNTTTEVTAAVTTPAAPLSNGNGSIQTTTTTTTTNATLPESSSIDEDTNDSLAISESTCDSTPEAPIDKLPVGSTTTSTSTKTHLDTSEGILDEPVAKKAKLTE